MGDQDPESPTEGIAVVGLSCRFPGADGSAELWRNLCGGVESIAVHSRAELAAAGVASALLDDPRYVRASGSLRDIQGFDAGFFGFSAREAELMDPQLRVFLECCWEALEDAGYDTGTYSGSIGLFAGMGLNGYLLHNLLSHRDLVHDVGPLQLRILNDGNYLTALASYKLDLRGPSVTVQSACSTSLVAVCMACQSLLQFQCDLAMAGGVTIEVPHGVGYLPQESVMSPDGHCRAFDADARGTVGGSGGGVVVFKRLSDALAEGDTIRAVIRGFAINNDGGFKASFTAPSLDGQVEVITMAQTVAGVPAESITYVEAHGTGTPLGDSVEIAALSEVFAASSRKIGFCALGSIKTNIGHLDAAAGVAGLIKAVLSVEKGVLLPSLHYKSPNPRIDFSRSPFYVNTECREWRPEGWPRRAGVSAFGIGGVNAHVVLEEPPAPTAADPERSCHLLLWSARTDTALDTATDRLLAHLREPRPDVEGLADVAYTLQTGRRAFRHRRMLVCRGREDAVDALGRRDPRRLLSGRAADDEPQLAFLFPGLGNQYAGMARDLYREDDGFRERIDDCAARLSPLLGHDLRQALYPDEEEGRRPAGVGIDLPGMLGRSGGGAAGETAGRLRRTALSQPAVFVVEYALACRLMDWGIQPRAMLGFSVGEYVAACLAGVFSLADALRLVAARAELIDALPPGAMLAVGASESEAALWLGTGLSLAAVAGPELTVLAGTEAAIAELEERLAAEGRVTRRLETSHAFHSTLMEPIRDRFLDLFVDVDLQPPTIPYLSNVTGDWITAEQAVDPEYWAEHLCSTVRFADAVGELWREPGRILLEIGPGQTLGSWALQHSACAGVRDPVVLPTMRHALERQDDLAFLLQSVGRLWLSGVGIDWPALWEGQRRRRVPLPTYPFERRRYWIERNAGGAASLDPAGPAVRSGPAAEAPAAPAIGSSRSPTYSRPSLHVPYAPPRDETERRLVEILGEILRLEQVGLHDSFFDLGGDSLLATHLVARLNRAFCVDLTLRSVFEAPTAAEMAAVLAARPEGGATVWGPVVRRIGGAPPPLSFAQQRLWFLEQLEPGDPAYNVPAAVLLTGALDVRALAASLDETVVRHETLRTTFGPAEEPVQRIAPPSPVPLPLIDLAELPPVRRESEARRHAVEEALRPFDLARGPLLRATLLRLDRSRHVVLLTMHHIAGDGWSSGILVRELAALYSAFMAGRPSPLPALPVCYADFVLWQREHLRGAALESQLAFWRSALAGAPPALELPTDRVRPARASGRGSLLWASVAAQRTGALAELGRRAGATPFMTLLAVFFAWLHRYSGQTDLVVGTPIANRRRPELEGLIGFFANTLVLRVELPPGDPTFVGLLAAVREAALSAYAHQDLPFERLVEELAPERSLARTPLFQVMFLLHSGPFGEHELPGLTLSPFGGLEPAGRAAKFDLTLELVDSGPELLALLELRRDLFDGATALRMLAHFTALIDSVVATLAGRITELPMLGEGERHQLAVEWSAGEELAGGGHGCLHHAFEARAREAPAAPALVCAEEVLTYGELDSRAGRLARHLRCLGVGPEMPVGVCAHRSADLVVALLAVLKAGGAYLPLDPAYPRERLAFLLGDAGAAVLLAPSGLADELLLPTGALRVALDEPETWNGGGALPPAVPDNLAYLIYTSGSTGLPKGVAVRHGGAVALVRWAAAAFSPDELSGVLASTSICFDLSVFEIFVPLSLGGRVILAANALELPRLPGASAVRTINTVPSAMAELVRMRAVPPSVRTVGLAGEPLRRDLVESIHAVAPGVDHLFDLRGAGSRRGRAAGDRPADRRHPGARAGRGFDTGPDRCPRGALSGRSRPGARLSGPPRPDGGGLAARSVRR
jgi:acyl transferase domain-containing protein/non-ribosomal peptide synthetase component F